MRDELAALTIASVVSLVMSAGPWNSSVLLLANVMRAAKSAIAGRIATSAAKAVNSRKLLPQR
jgi:hypothetical protein